MIDVNQYAFMNNIYSGEIIFYHEIMHNYHFKGGSPCMSLKINLHKTNDLVR